MVQVKKPLVTAPLKIRMQGFEKCHEIVFYILIPQVQGFWSRDP